MNRIACLIAAAALPICSLADSPLTFTKQWTYSHAEGTPDQVSEIPAYDRLTNTIWVAGVVGVDVLDAMSGNLITHIDVTQYGFVNSVAISNGIAALAIESSLDRRNPGKVVLYDTRTQSPLASKRRNDTNIIPVGSLPDMLTFTPNGRSLLVANEGTPNSKADDPYDLANDPAGSVSIIDVLMRKVIATPTFENVPLVNGPRTSAGMDFEPEYIAVNAQGTRAYVILQEANAIGVLDLRRNRFEKVIGLGLKDFSLADNGFGGNNFIDPSDEDPKADPVINLRPSPVKGLYQPDAVATYQYQGKTFLVMANEGDTREDEVDKARGSKVTGTPNDLKRLNISLPDSPNGSELVTFGGRSFSIRDENGELVYDSGSLLDAEAIARKIYNDGRSDDKGVEPEGVSLMQLGGKTYAFIGLERTKVAAVAVFDVTNPRAVSFVDMLVTDGDVSPEGLVTYTQKGRHYLGIANEVSNTTTLYEITQSRVPRGGKNRVFVTHDAE